MGKTKSDNNVNHDEKILEYLRKTNRPYSATDITLNLKSQISKASLTKILSSLTENGSVVTKNYGKQQVFVATQSDLPSLSADELQALDMEIKSLEEKMLEKSKEVKGLKETLNTLKSSLTTKELNARITHLNEENSKKQHKLISLEGGVQLADPKEKLKISKKLEFNRKAWKERKNLVNFF